MRLKQEIGDFRVRELLAPGYTRDRGPHRLYRVTKRKLTSDEAARALAAEAGVDPSEVSLGGLKDRQAIAIQHMSVPGGRPVEVRTRDLVVTPIGFAEEAMSSEQSLGNAFEITIRGLRRADLAVLRGNVPVVRGSGLVAYFDDQRFGNLRHGQGWVARDLALGRHGEALRALVASPSPHDPEREARLKAAILERWGDWRACRDLAGKLGRHMSVFEHLAKGGDLAGAFRRVASRVRLIHLYAWQSHLWNRAVCELVRRTVPAGERVVMESVEGPLVSFGPAGPPEALRRRGTFRLPGERLEDVRDPEERELLADALAADGVAPERFSIEGVPGFQLKGEDRALFVVPRFLRVRPPAPDPLNRGLSLVRLRFELPRGEYATLVVKRLLARPLGERGGERRRDESAAPGGPAEGRGPRRAQGRGEGARDRGWGRRARAERGEGGRRGRDGGGRGTRSDGGRGPRGAESERRTRRRGGDA